MQTTKRAHRYSSAVTAHLNELLDEAAKASFPANDPIVINFELGVTRTRNSNDDQVFTLRSEAQQTRVEQ